MSEISIAKPISGPEALESCLFELRKALSRDDRFGSHMAYNGFQAIINFRFYPQLSFVPPVEREIEVVKGDQSDISESPTIDEAISIPVRPPNKVREEAELPQPVLVTDAQGRSIEKWVNHSGVRPTQPVRPKNLVVKGA